MVEAAAEANDTLMEKFLEDTGVEVTVQIRRQDVRVKVWKTEHFGNAPLYLLDTDLPDNPDAWTTGQLYGWFGEERVAQEIVLGAGGVRALRALGIEVDVYHFNEGHALFAGFELLREKMEDRGMSFKKAVKASRKEIVFTTHTPVIQGNETHPIERLLYMGANLSLSKKQLKKTGRQPFQYDRRRAASFPHLQRRRPTPRQDRQQNVEEGQGPL